MVPQLPVLPHQLIASSLAPDDLSFLNKLENEVNLLLARVVDDLLKPHHVWMVTLLQDRNLPSNLLGLLVDRTKLSKTRASRESLKDLDCNVFARFEVPTSFDFAVNTSTNFFVNLVLIENLATGELIYILIKDVCFFWGLLVSPVQKGIGICHSSVASTRLTWII
jgi:hypothetical protein